MATLAPPVDEPGFDLYASRKSTIQAANIVLIILPTIFVTLRLTSRFLAHAGLWLDDLLIVLALIFSYGLPVSNLVATEQCGLGRHIYILPLSSTRKFLHMLYPFEILFSLTSCASKCSILAFYRRIFPITQLRPVLLATTAVVLAFHVVGILTTVFQCVPIHMFWDVAERMASDRTRCINVDVYFLVTGSINCFLDFFIVLIVSSVSLHSCYNPRLTYSQPIPLLWRLRTTTFQKVILTSIFLIAGL